MCLLCTGEEAGCTDDFPSLQDVQCQAIDRIKNFDSTRLIPGMNFTYSGTIEKVSVVGMQQNGNKRRVKLQIWRPYYGTRHCRVNTIELSFKTWKKRGMVCDDIYEYECTLKKNEQISVKSGDILGIKLPPSHNANFELYSVTESGLTNYIFKQDHSSTIDSTSASTTKVFDLRNRTTETTAQPLIRIEVNSSKPGNKCTIVHFHSSPS